jgi:hypothetical protein
VDRRATALFLAQTWFARQPNVVADLTGYTARQVNNWCRGRARVPRWAAALAVVLGAHSPADIRRMVEGATIWADAGDTRGPPADGHPDIRGVQPAG